MKLSVMGAAGRMGRSILRLAYTTEGIQIVGACDAPSAPQLGQDAGELSGVGKQGVVVQSDIETALQGADVCIDFSSPHALPAIADAVKVHRVAWVCGTTGFDSTAQKYFEDAALAVPVLWAPNMSPAIQILAELVQTATERLGAEFDIEIIETHHRQKTDAPSGTARRLAEAVAAARPDLEPVTGREGQVGKRKTKEMGLFALRGGDVIGDHTVHFFGPGERLELTHRATNRDLFAYGAIRAARFLVGKPAQRYHLSDLR